MHEEKGKKSGFDFLTSEYNVYFLLFLKWKIPLLRYRHAGGIALATKSSIQWNIGKHSTLTQI